MENVNLRLLVLEMLMEVTENRILTSSELPPNKMPKRIMGMPSCEPIFAAGTSMVRTLSGACGGGSGVCIAAFTVNPFVWKQKR